MAVPPRCAALCRSLRPTGTWTSSRTARALNYRPDPRLMALDISLKGGLYWSSGALECWSDGLSLQLPKFRLPTLNRQLSTTNYLVVVPEFEADLIALEAGIWGV